MISKVLVASSAVARARPRDRDVASLPTMIELWPTPVPPVMLMVAPIRSPLGMPLTLPVVMVVSPLLTAADVTAPEIVSVAMML